MTISSAVAIDFELALELFANQAANVNSEAEVTLELGILLSRAPIAKLITWRLILGWTYLDNGLLLLFYVPNSAFKLQILTSNILHGRRLLFQFDCSLGASAANIETNFDGAMFD